MKKIVHFALLALIASSALLSAPVLSSLVLCLGTDGHFDLEYSNNGKCGASNLAAQSPSVAPFEESHCGTCTDVALIGQSEDSIRPTNGFLAGQNLAYVPNPMLQPFHLERSTVGHFSQPPPFELPLLVHLRTIRLLV